MYFSLQQTVILPLQAFTRRGLEKNPTLEVKLSLQGRPESRYGVRGPGLSVEEVEIVGALLSRIRLLGATEGLIVKVRFFNGYYNLPQRSVRCLFLALSALHYVMGVWTRDGPSGGMTFNLSTRQMPPEQSATLEKFWNHFAGCAKFFFL